ncbi:MAG: hypothetical protein RIR70_808 [Pseudomonadota bacterium]|jgi:BolA protein
MSDTQSEIRARLLVLNPLVIELKDDSALHAGHEGAKGGGGHYRLKIISQAFEGQRTLNRHRMIYDALGDLMHQKIHALGIEALSPSETQT